MKRLSPAFFDSGPMELMDASLEEISSIVLETDGRLTVLQKTGAGKKSTLVNVQK